VNVATASPAAISGKRGSGNYRLFRIKQQIAQGLAMHPLLRFRGSSWVPRTSFSTGCSIIGYVSGINSTTALWYVSRATGLVTLVLLTAVAVLGILVTRKGRLPGLPSFAVTGLHRNLSLLAVAFTGVHVLTAVVDSYVSIPLISVVVPFTSGYERLTTAFGAISLDLMAAMIITSLLRRHLSPKFWRAVHWLAYVSWPVAFLHCLLASKDLRHGWMFGITVLAGAAVVGASLWRLSAAVSAVPRARRVAAMLARSDAKTSVRHVSADGGRR
jgi:methionine sulfoxide reductase heme-binding subunit